MNVCHSVSHPVSRSVSSTIAEIVARSVTPFLVTTSVAMALFAIPLSNAMAQDVSRVTTTTVTVTSESASPTGFLSDYTRLAPALSENNDFQSYAAADALGRNLGRVYVMPLVVYPENAKFDYIDRATLAALQSKFSADLTGALSNKLIVVAAPDQADTIIQMAVTNVAAEEPGRRPRDFLPFRLITKPIKDATMGKQQEVLVTMEMKVMDVKSNQTVFELLDRAKSKTMGRTGDENLHADSKDLEPVIDTWVKKVTKSVMALQTGKS